MRYGSVCSGVEAASLAWESLGWQPAWFAEIEPFPAAVLDHHWPHVQNHGDMTQLEARILSGEIEAPDILVGGTPCQAFSVAGLRNSLDDERGNLTLVLVRILNAIDEVRKRLGKPPAILVWENVPGVLNTKDNAFGSFLAGLAGEELPLEPAGKRWTNAGCVFGPQRAVAWRVLDAQYFGVAQRRRRVFVVASAREGFNPAEVLFEFDGLRRDIAPSRETGQEAAADAGRGSHWDSQHLPHPTLNQSANTGGIGASNQEVFSQRGGGLVPMRMRGFGDYVSDSTESTVKARDYKDATDLIMVNGRQDPITSTIAQPLDVHQQTNVVCIKGNIIDRLPENGGNGLGVDGGGIAYTLTASDRHAVAYCNKNRGDMVETCYNKGINHNGDNCYGSTQETNANKILRALRKEVGEEAFTQWGLGVSYSFLEKEVLRPLVHGKGVRCETNEGGYKVVNSALSRKKACAEGQLCELWQAGRERRTPQRWGLEEQCRRELGAYLSQLSQQGASNKTFMRDMWYASEGIGVLREALSEVQETRRPYVDESKPVHASYAVRRLTPKEAERLQGFPDGHTQIPWRGKPAEECPDAPRYKACGNSMAVPCMRFIGKRIQGFLNEQI